MEYRFEMFLSLSLTFVFLNSSLNPVIYCRKMRHIRHAIVDILRNTSWLRNLALHFYLEPVTSSVFVFECNDFLLEDDTYSTHYHGHTAKHFLAEKFPLRPHLETSYFQCCYFKEWLTTSPQLSPSLFIFLISFM